MRSIRQRRDQTLELGTPAGNTSLIGSWGHGGAVALLNTTVNAFAYDPGVGPLTLKGVRRADEAFRRRACSIQTINTPNNTGDSACELRTTDSP